MDKNNVNRHVERSEILFAKKSPYFTTILNQSGLNVDSNGENQNKRKGISGDFSSVRISKSSNGDWRVFDGKGRFGTNSFDSIGFIMNLTGRSFVESVIMLNNASYNCSNKLQNNEKKRSLPLAWDKKEFTLPSPCCNNKKAREYLTSVRSIPEPIVDVLMDIGRIYQSFLYGQYCIAFPINTGYGDSIGASLVFPEDDENKHRNAAGSSFNFGWSFTYYRGKKEDRRTYFFESAIDAMSFLAIHGCGGAYVSMEGLRENHIENYNFMTGNKPVICVDNDSAGNDFYNNLCCDYERLIPDYGVKDWNEQLVYMNDHGLSSYVKIDPGRIGI